MYRQFVLFIVIFLTFINFSFAQSGMKISGNITDQFGSLPGVQVIIQGTGLSTKTDIEGNYSIDIIPGSYIISASFTTYKTVTKTVTIESDTLLKIDFVLATGFSINPSVSIDSRTPSSILNTSAPVDVVSAQDIANSSQTDLTQILQFLVPSFHSARQTISDGTDHVDPVALRGLGPDQILILINGKRRHNSALLNVNGTVGRGTAGTDLNTIPITAIDRIEILRDGATSQYGSDAIAGVINIILKNDSETTNIFSKTNITTEGDGFTNVFGGNFGFKVGNKGFINATAEYRNRESTNRAGDFTGPVFSTDSILDAQLIEDNDFFGQTGFSGRRVMEIGNAATEDFALVINSEIPISDNSKFYAHGLSNTRIGNSRGFYRFPRDETRVVLELNPNGFSPEIETDIDDNSIFAGFKTKRNDWNIDFSYGFGVNRIGFNVLNSNNASLGVNSPRNFFSGAYRYSQKTANIDINRSFKFKKGLNFAFGAETRKENYVISAGDEASYIDGGSTFINDDGVVTPRIAGAQVFPGITPENEIDRSRTISSLYYDIDAHLTDKLLVKVAGRFVSSQNISNQFIWKLSSRYNFNDNFGLRVGYSTGSRLPSLHQLFFQNKGTQFIATGPAQVGTFNTESSVAEAFGLGNLKAESSEYFSVGFNGKLSDKFTFSFNFYNIEIDDRIVLSGRISEGFDDILEPLNVSIVQLFTNALNSNTSGFDATLAYQRSLGRGRFNTTLSGNITNTETSGNIRVPEPLVGFEDVFFSREEIARVISSQPRSKFISTLSYDINKFRFFARNTYFGSVFFAFPLDTDPANFVINEFTGLRQSRDQKFTSKITTDLSVSYKVSNALNINAGGNNVFNVFPDRVNHSALSGDGSFIFSRRVQQFNVNGANYFIGLQVKL